MTAVLVRARLPEAALTVVGTSTALVVVYVAADVALLRRRGQGYGDTAVLVGLRPAATAVLIAAVVVVRAAVIGVGVTAGSGGAPSITG